jgi:MFS family permease
MKRGVYDRLAVVQGRKIYGLVIAATAGTFIEWYDFFLAGIASIGIWPSLFFSGLGPTVAIAVSYGSYFIAHLSRPIGAIVFGHLGDRVGRKSTLMLTLVIASIATLGIALCPSSAEIGALAGALIIALRLVYGLAIGGEWGGATSWLSEHTAKSKWRGFWTSFAGVTLALGVSISALVFAFTQSWMRPADFISWGWRWLFGIGAVMLLVAMVIRCYTTESPLFSKLKNQGALEKAPALEVFRKNWRTIGLLILVNLGASVTVNGIYYPFVIGYLALYKVSTVFVTFSVAIAYLITSFMIPLVACASDLYGRRKMLAILTSLMLIAAIVFFPLANTLDYTLIALAGLFIVGATISSIGALIPIVQAENFPTKERYSGVGITFQLTTLSVGLLGSILNPILMIMSGGLRGMPPYLVTEAIIGLIISLVAISRLKESKSVDMEKIV